MVSVDTILDSQHSDILGRAIQNVLRTDLALLTYGQIVDGLPLGNVAQDRYGCLGSGHPVDRHTSLCPGALETARKFLFSELTLDMLELDAKLLGAYQAAPPGHRSFQARLIELVAVAIHQAAVILWSRRHRLHDHPETGVGASNPADSINVVTAWVSRELPFRRPPDPNFYIPAPTLLSHPWYTALGQYPAGLADVVGYWAENRVLGGVVLFDRSRDAWGNGDDHDDGNGGEREPNIYLHSDRSKVTFLLWQALDGQQQALVDFLLSSPSAEAADGHPLPLSASDENRKRLHPENATGENVYRDVWERAPPRVKSMWEEELEDCKPNPLDYPR